MSGMGAHAPALAGEERGDEAPRELDRVAA